MINDSAEMIKLASENLVSSAEGPIKQGRHFLDKICDQSHGYNKNSMPIVDLDTAARHVRAVLADARDFLTTIEERREAMVMEERHESV